MAAQRLGPRTIRRLSRATGLTITRAWAHGGYRYAFYVPVEGVAGDPLAHRHGWYDLKTGDWGWTESPIHYTSCAEAAV